MDVQLKNKNDFDKGFAKLLKSKNKQFKEQNMFSNPSESLIGEASLDNYTDRTEKNLDSG